MAYERTQQPVEDVIAVSADKSVAKASLLALENEFAQYSDEERATIAHLRSELRRMVAVHGAAAEIAMMANSFECAIRRGQ